MSNVLSVYMASLMTEPGEHQAEMPLGRPKVWPFNSGAKMKHTQEPLRWLAVQVAGRNSATWPGYMEIGKK